MSNKLPMPSKFYITYGSVIGDKRLNNTEKVIFGIIVGLSNTYGYAFAANEYYAEVMQCKPRAIQNALSNLEKYGHITRDYGVNQSTGLTDRRIRPQDITVEAMGDDNVFNDIYKKKLEKEAARGASKDTGGCNQMHEGVHLNAWGGAEKCTHNNTTNSITNSITNKEASKSEASPSNPDVVEIIDYLNEQTNRTGTKQFEAGKKAHSLLERILKDYEIKDCKQVIDNKVASWENDENMNQYLRPETLFRWGNFKKYVLEKPIVKGVEKYEKRYERETKEKLY